MDTQIKYVKNAIFFFLGVIIMLGLGLSTVIQGVLTHLTGDTFLAVIHYFIAAAAAITAIWLYKRGMKWLEDSKYF